MSDPQPGARWRRATLDDLDAMMEIQGAVHSLLPEPREIFADKMSHFGEGCLVLDFPGTMRGYGIAHPWRLDDAPALDTPLGALPADADCLFIHDVALVPAARGRGASAAFIRSMAALARGRGLASMALVSVYGTVPVWERCGFAVRVSGLPAGKLDSYGDTARYMTARVP